MWNYRNLEVFLDFPMLHSRRRKKTVGRAIDQEYEQLQATIVSYERYKDVAICSEKQEPLHCCLHLVIKKVTC